MELKEKDMDPTDNSFIREEYLEDMLRNDLKGRTKAELTDRVVTLTKEKNMLFRSLSTIKKDLESTRSELKRKLEETQMTMEGYQRMYETNVDAQLLERWMKISRYYAQINAALLMMV